MGRFYKIQRYILLAVATYWLSWPMTVLAIEQGQYEILINGESLAVEVYNPHSNKLLQKNILYHGEVDFAAYLTEDAAFNIEASLPNDELNWGFNPLAAYNYHWSFDSEPFNHNIVHHSASLENRLFIKVTDNNQLWLEIINKDKSSKLATLFNLNQAVPIVISFDEDSDGTASKTTLTIQVVPHTD